MPHSEHRKGRTTQRSPEDGARGGGKPVRPKKSLGQNFLQDPNIARKIVESLNLHPHERVLEIGPGMGMLTGQLAASGAEVVAVEIDGRAVEHLMRRLRLQNLRLVHQDFLELDLHGLAGDRVSGRSLRVVGNIPYNITSPILFRLLDARQAFQDATLMMQREVARRLVARPGTRDYGILTVLCGMLADVLLLFNVSPNAFRPKPRVMSTLIRLTPLREPRYPVQDFEFFRAMVRFVFGQRRKTLRNSLRAFMGNLEWAPPAGVNLMQRPEDLDLQSLTGLANHLIRFARSQ